MSGRLFLQIPGPTNVPERIVQAMSRSVIDHRAPTFAALTREVVPALRQVFGTRDGAVIIYPCSGNELKVLATLGGLEMALLECGVPLALGSGVAACQRIFVRTPAGLPRRSGPSRADPA